MHRLRLRILATVLALVLATGAARADLDHGHFRAVFHAPLGMFWILRPEGSQASHRFSEVLLSLRVEKEPHPAPLMTDGHWPSHWSSVRQSRSATKAPA